MLKKKGSKFLKTSGQKALEKAAPAVGDYIGSKIADKITFLKDKPQEEIESERFPEEEPEEIIIPPEKRQKKLNNIPKFTAIKWIEIFDRSNGTYNPNKDIRFKTPQMRDDLCDFNDAYSVVTGKISAINSNLPNGINTIPNDACNPKKITLKGSAPFFNCTLKINNQLIEDAQDLDIVNPIYNLLYYSKNVKKITGSFWNYYQDKPKEKKYFIQ